MGPTVASFVFVGLLIVSASVSAETIIKTERQIADGKIYEIWTERMSDGSTRERRMLLLNNGSFMEEKDAQRLSAPSSSPEKSIFAPQNKTNNPVAVFHVNPDLFRDFGATIYQSINTQEDITTTTGSGSATVSVRPSSSSNSIGVNIDVNMSGSARTQGGMVIPRAAFRGLPQRSVSVTMDNTVTGYANTTIYLDENGARNTPVTANADIHLGQAHASSSGFVSPAVGGLARKVGRNKANEKAQEVRPAKEQEIEAQLAQAMRDATKKVDEKVREGVRKAAEMPQTKDLGKDFVRTLRSSPTDGAEVAVYSKTLQGEGSKAPAVPRSSQMAAEIKISEDFVNQALNNKVASMKKVKLSKAIKEICDDGSMRRFALCALDLEGIFANVEVTFDENDPIRVTLRDGKIKLEMNAVHDMNLANKEGATPSFQGNPYHVEIVYKVGKSGLERELVSVTPRDGDRPAFDFLAEGSKSSDQGGEKTTHGLEAGAEQLLDQAKVVANRMIRGLSDSAERKALEQAYEKAMLPKVDFPNQIVPAKMQMQDPRPGVEPTVVGSLRLFSGFAASENGWFTARIDREPVSGR